MLLQEYLKEKNLTQCQAAEALGVGQGLISSWINGERLPRPENMKKIKEWTEDAVQPNDFYLDKEEEKKDA